MSKFQVGKKVFIPKLNKIGVITKLDTNGKPKEVLIGNEVINVVNMLVQLYSILKPIFIFFKNLFKKR